MANIKLIFRKGKKILLVALLILLIAPNILTSQTHNTQHFELPDYAIKNYLEGLHSGNYGIMMSCLFYAGKYKLSDVSKDLLEIIQNSTDDEISQMAIWSLYQIGEDPLCEKLESLLKNHPSEKLRKFCSFLHMIREYETALAKN
jgi:hypothetical protein